MQAQVDEAGRCAQVRVKIQSVPFGQFVVSLPTARTTPGRTLPVRRAFGWIGNKQPGNNDKGWHREEPRRIAEKLLADGSNDGAGGDASAEKQDAPQKRVCPTRGRHIVRHASSTESNGRRWRAAIAIQRMFGRPQPAGRPQSRLHTSQTTGAAADFLQEFEARPCHCPAGGCQSSTLLPSGSMTQPNFPYSESSVFSRTLQPSSRSACNSEARSSTR